MSTGADLKASWILERVGAEIPGAQVEYVRGEGMHRFVIVHRALNYDVGFPEWLLEACSVKEINWAVHLVIERIQTEAGPRRIRIGPRSGNRREAA